MSHHKLCNYNCWNLDGNTEFDYPRELYFHLESPMRMPAADFHIETPRLLLTYFDAAQDSHCDFLVDLHKSEHHARWADREAARKTIASSDPSANAGWGRYLINLKPPPPPKSDTNDEKKTDDSPFSTNLDACTPVGTVGIKFRSFRGAPLVPDIGYALVPEYQGRGYATEAGMALVRWCEEVKGHRGFFGFCDRENEGSKGVLRRMGFEERGVWKIRGIYSDDEVIVAMVFSKGVTGDLEAYELERC